MTRAARAGSHRASTGTTGDATGWRLAFLSMERSRLFGLRIGGAPRLRSRQAARVAETRAREAKESMSTPAHIAISSCVHPARFHSIEMQRAFAANGDYGVWFRSRRAVARINGVLFVHGGTSDESRVARLSRNQRHHQREISHCRSHRQGRLAADDVGDRPALVSVDWHRTGGGVSPPRWRDSPAMNARAIVVGHTPTAGRITTRSGGRVVQITPGCSTARFYPVGGCAGSARDAGGAFTAVYLDRREHWGPSQPQRRRRKCRYIVNPQRTRRRARSDPRSA